MMLQLPSFRQEKAVMSTKRRMLGVCALLFLLVCSCPTTLAKKKDRNQPQGHTGILKPYQPGPFKSLKLSASDEKLLAEGKPVMKQTLPTKDNPEGGGAICVQDVDAPRQAVWNQILDLNSYKGKVPKIVASSNYVNRKNSNGTHTIKTRMVIGVMPGYSVRNLRVVNA